MLTLTVALTASTATAQTQVDPTTTRPSTATTAGDTGLWTVPTGEVLPARQRSLSLGRPERTMGQGLLDISTVPLSLGVGLGHHTEVFGGWHMTTRLDGASRLPFLHASSLNSTSSSGSKHGERWLGAKINVPLGHSDRSLALAVRPMVKVSTGNPFTGTNANRTDFAADVIVSSEARQALDLSGYGGFLLRGKQDAYMPTHGFRWGVGAAFPSRRPVRVLVELHGERYFDRWITAAPGLTGTDGFTVPLSTALQSPIRLNLGLTFQLPRRMFVGLGTSWNVTASARGLVDSGAYLVRVGFHPGVRRATRSIVPASMPPAPINGVPTVRASCDPCTVETGKVSTVSADVQGIDATVLTFEWRAPTGSLTNRADRRTPWTAPLQVGTVPVTVTVDDGHGGMASDTVNIRVIKPAIKTSS